MRLLVAGSRDYPSTHRGRVIQVLNRIYAEWNERRLTGEEFHVISGHSVDKKGWPTGPDWWAEAWAKHFGIAGTYISINDIGGWNAYPGKSAGHHRNLKLAERNPTHALIFWDGESSGAYNMLKIIHCKAPPVPRRILFPDTIEAALNAPVWEWNYDYPIRQSKRDKNMPTLFATNPTTPARTEKQL